MIYPLVRSGVRTAISVEPDIHVVGEADNGLNAIKMTRQLRPTWYSWKCQCL
jgi:DNA-binding NarL/FixJ family response regulator